MRLRYSPSSPYTRKVLVVAAEGGLLERIELVPTNVRAPSAELLADNPLAKIPVLLLEDGTELFDSRVICEYLDAQSGQTLFPTSGIERWRALRQQALADGVMDAGLLIRQEHRRDAPMRSSDWITAQTGRLSRGVKAMSREIQPSRDMPTIGTIAIAVSLSYLDFRYPEVGWRDDARLAGWYEAFSKRPSMVGSVLKEKT